ncbi:diguanylate cyclase [Alteromonadaceae bacterium BrNp21-10]|nr:diguanylate cyclase [Alteromonadaceae bacterium BrNp21-10]
MQNILLTDNIKSGHWWLLLVIMLVCIGGIYQLSHLASNTLPLAQLNQQAKYVIDEDHSLNITQVITLPESAWLQQNTQLSFGMSDDAYWVRFDVEPDHNRLIELEYPLIDDVTLWFYQQEHYVQHIHTGDAQPFFERNITHEKFIFAIPESEISPLTVYMRVQSSGTIRLPINLWDEQQYLLFSSEYNMVMGLFFGFLAAMAFSNLFFFLTTQSNNFLIYSIYTMCLGLTLASLHGLGYKYLWPSSPWLQQHAMAIFVSATVAFALLFTSRLLNIKLHNRLLGKAIDYLALAFVVMLLIGLALPFGVLMQTLLVAVCLCIVFLYSIGVWYWIKGVVIARIYTLAWTILAFSGLLISLEHLNILHLPIRSHYLLMLGATIETALFAMVLAINFNQQRQEIDDAHVKTLNKERQLREAHEKIIAVQEQAQADLEYKVDERTLELKIALQELEETNRELEERNTIDSLTGIRNRRYFDKKYVAEIRRSRREQTELAVAMVDIDHFKNVNDTLGHLVGDECIRFVAKTLQDSLKRPSDEVCRYGGEEFAILMPNTTETGAMAVIDQLRDTIHSTPIATSAGAVNINISAGVSSAVIQMQDQDTALLDMADKALYQAKTNGRNRVEFNSLTAKA